MIVNIVILIDLHLRLQFNWIYIESISLLHLLLFLWCNSKNRKLNIQLMIRFSSTFPTNRFAFKFCIDFTWIPLGWVFIFLNPLSLILVKFFLYLLYNFYRFSFLFSQHLTIFFMKFSWIFHIDILEIFHSFYIKVVSFWNIS